MFTLNDDHKNLITRIEKLKGIVKEYNDIALTRHNGLIKHHGEIIVNQFFSGVVDFYKSMGMEMVVEFRQFYIYEGSADFIFNVKTSDGHLKDVFKVYVNHLKRSDERNEVEISYYMTTCDNDFELIRLQGVGLLAEICRKSQGCIKDVTKYHLDQIYEELTILRTRIERLEKTLKDWSQLDNDLFIQLCLKSEELFFRSTETSYGHMSFPTLSYGSKLIRQVKYLKITKTTPKKFYLTVTNNNPNRDVITNSVILLKDDLKKFLRNNRKIIVL